MSEISRKTGELYESPLTYEEIRWFRKFKKECILYNFYRNPCKNIVLWCPIGAELNQ